MTYSYGYFVIIASRLYSLAPDSPPQNLTAQSLSSSSILITWSPPPLINQNGPIIRYNLTYIGAMCDIVLRIVIIDVNETNSQLSQQITIQGLYAYTNYIIGVSAITLNGSSEFSYIRQRTNESGILRCTCVDSLNCLRVIYFIFPQLNCNFIVLL